MPEQLALDVDQAESVTQSPAEVDLAVSVLTAHGGDAVAAIKELLLDADFLRDQLYVASTLMSAGMSRGWKPKYERV